MKEIICGEFYRLRFNKSYKIAMLLIYSVLITVCLFFRFYYHDDSFGASFRCLVVMFRYILPLTIVFNFNIYEEYRYNTIKNICSINKRTEIYLGKIVFQIVVNVVTYVVAIGLYLILSLIITDHRIDEYNWGNYFGAFILAMMILFHNTLLVDLLMIIVRNEIVIVLLYAVLTNFISLLFEYIPWTGELINKVLISEQFLYLQELSFIESEFIQNICVVLCVIIIYGIAGCFAFKYSEVK